jgi:hypothetical protein
MRLLLWLSSLATLASLALALVCLIHVPVIKHSTADAANTIERYVVQRAELPANRASALDGALSTIRGNERSVFGALNGLRRVAVSGFLALAAFNLAIAILARSFYRQERHAKVTTGEG